MATTGELLVEMSTLTTGTALEHFTNISFGGGPGGGGDQATDYMEEALTRLLFMNEDLPLIGDQDGLKGSDITGNYYMALFVSDPGEEGSQVDEASYIGYSRVPVIRGASGWEYKSGSAKNIPIITWQPCVLGIQTITHFAVMDSLEGGNVLWYGELPSPIDVTPGDSVEYAYNQFVVKLY